MQQDDQIIYLFSSDLKKKYQMVRDKNKIKSIKDLKTYAKKNFGFSDSEIFVVNGMNLLSIPTVLDPKYKIFVVQEKSFKREYFNCVLVKSVNPISNIGIAFKVYTTGNYLKDTIRCS